MRLLLAEDDRKIADFLVRGLNQAGFRVDLAADGSAAQSLLRENEYDLLILDVMLPKVDGLTIVRDFRKSDQTTPILILSAKRSVEDRVRGLQEGSDDYLTKPFSMSELLARISALHRRTTKVLPPESPTVIQSSGVVLNLLTREVTREGKKIELQAKEFQLVEYFLKNPGRLISKAEILERIWNYHFDPQTNVVDVLVFRLRSKIDKDFDTKLIQTVRGVGYVLQTH